MKCPQCGKDGFIVADSRPSRYGTRRKRVCHGCGYRMRTIEIPENDLRSIYAVRKACLQIVKESFDRIKNVGKE